MREIRLATDTTDGDDLSSMNHCTFPGRQGQAGSRDLCPRRVLITVLVRCLARSGEGRRTPRLGSTNTHLQAARHRRLEVRYAAHFDVGCYRGCQSLCDTSGHGPAGASGLQTRGVVPTEVWLRYEHVIYSMNVVSEVVVGEKGLGGGVVN